MPFSKRHHWPLLPLLPPSPPSIIASHCEEASKNPSLAAEILSDSDYCHQQLRPRHCGGSLLPGHHLHLFQLQHEHPESPLVQPLHPPPPRLLLPLPLPGRRAQQRESLRHFSWSAHFNYKVKCLNHLKQNQQVLETHIIQFPDFGSIHSFWNICLQS